MPIRLESSVRVTLLTLLSFFVATLPAGADGRSGLPHAEEYRESISLVRDVLAPRQTRGDMIDLVGATPLRCVDVPGGAEICVWSLSKREAVWWPLAELLDTGDRLNLICEFPANDAPRSKDSCSVHTKRSNRGYYRDQLRGRRPGASMRRKSGARVPRAELKAQAQQVLTDARTAIELSTLVGDAPEDCRSRDAVIVCVWKSNAGTYGHGSLAISIDADSGKRVRMNCRLPADGAPRDADACRVEIGR